MAMDGQPRLSVSADTDEPQTWRNEEIEMPTLRNNDQWNNEFSADSTKIDWLVDGNPKRPSGKAAQRFDMYFGAQTVGEYLTAGGSRADLRYDWQHQFFDLVADEDAVIETEPATEMLDAADPDVIIEEAITKGKKSRKDALAADELLIG